MNLTVWSLNSRVKAYLLKLHAVVGCSVLSEYYFLILTQKHHATSRKFMVSIPDEVVRFFN
jgi:hypothetical protein